MIDTDDTPYTFNHLIVMWNPKFIDVKKNGKNFNDDSSYEITKFMNNFLFWYGFIKNH